MDNSISVFCKQLIKQIKLKNCKKLIRTIEISPTFKDRVLYGYKDTNNIDKYVNQILKELKKYALKDTKDWIINEKIFCKLCVFFN